MPKGVYLTWETARNYLEASSVKAHLIDELPGQSVKGSQVATHMQIYNLIDLQALIRKYGGKPAPVEKYLTRFQRYRHKEHLSS